MNYKLIGIGKLLSNCTQNLFEILTCRLLKYYTN